MELTIDQIKQQARFQRLRMQKYHGNPEKVILSMFDYTGAWSQPYVDAGYTVIQLDQKFGYDIIEWMPVPGSQAFFDIPGEDFKDWTIHGILAAPPCDDIASSGARWWSEKDIKPADYKDSSDRCIFKNRKEFTEWIIHTVIWTADYWNPMWWALENPVGRMKDIAPSLGEKKMCFDPYEYAGWADDPDQESYTKKSCLWGNFNIDLQRKPVQPVHGSKMHKVSGWDKEKQKEIRSTTPQGFARAFFKANL